MNRIIVENNEAAEAGLLGRYAQESEMPTQINDDTLVLSSSGSVLIAYWRRVVNTQSMKSLLRSVQFGSCRRMSKEAAFDSTSTPFGYKPRVHQRWQPCKVATLMVDQPAVAEVLVEWTKRIMHCYADCNPALAASHAAKAANIRPDYKIGDTVFTSGIINRSSQLPYHFDRGNFEGAWSAMIGIQDGVSGGRLNIPRYGLSLDIADGSLTMFDGQAALHGVTPIQRNGNDSAHRYTLVWYSLKGMWKCVTTEEELARVNASTSAGNRRKAKLPPA